MTSLTRRQQQIFDYLHANWEHYRYPPTLQELATGLGLVSTGSLYRHIMILVKAGLVEPFLENKKGGIRLTPSALANKPDHSKPLPFLGIIAAGQPIEAVSTMQFMDVPLQLVSDKPCYVLQVKGDSMVEVGIFDGDWVVIEQRQVARNGEIVVALINQADATLKILEVTPDQVRLHPANPGMAVQAYRPDQVEVQGVLIGQMRRYH